MSVTAITPESEPSVTVTGDAVYIDNFVEICPEVVETIRNADDRVAAVHVRLELGSKVLRLATATVDTEAVKSEFEKMTTALYTVTGDTIGKITQAADALLQDETGSLPVALTGFRTELAGFLDDAFDEDSKSSVIAKFDNLYRRATEDQLAQFRRLINPDSPDSPLGAWRQDIVRTLNEQSATILRELQEVREKFAVAAATEAARADALEYGTRKGFVYEDLLHALIEPVAAACGDLAEQCGLSTGACGTKNGDEVVTINPDELRGRRGAYVLEVKDRKLTTPKTFSELDSSMANREAVVGIAVFSRQELAPTTMPFQPFGNKAIVVIDKTDPDPNVMRLVHLWARLAVRRAVGEPSDADALNLDKIETLLDDARRSLKRIITIKGAHSTVKKSVQRASEELTELEGELHSVLDALSLEIKS